MDIYKEYVFRLRKIELDEVCILVFEDTSPKLKKYVKLITETRFDEGGYHTYYGALKRILVSLNVYWKEIVNKATIDIDKCRNTMTKNDLLSIIESTIDIHNKKQIDFYKDYAPINTKKDEQNHEEIELKFKDFIKELLEIKSRIKKLDKEEKIVKFRREQFEVPMTQLSKIFDFTHTYISMILADHLYEIRVSLEEIHLRMRKNSLNLETELNEKKNKLLHVLYEKNKEMLNEDRQYTRNTEVAAQINRDIQRIREKIQNSKCDHSVENLRTEVRYWETRIKDFNEIASVLTKLKLQQENIIKQEKIYDSYKCTELRGSKQDAWENIGRSYEKRLEFLNKKIVETAKSLITFFSLREGNNCMTYSDDLGIWQHCEYGHQTYLSDSGLRNYHLDCRGNCRQVLSNNKYYYDRNGRYLLDKNGEKVYQAASCSSLYRINEDYLMEKVTKDCGHSERYNKECKMNMGSSFVSELLPDVEMVDVKGKLDKDAVNYIWTSFGCILPHALQDVAQLQPIKPIHYLAHRIIFHKYNVNSNKKRIRKMEADDYRDKIYKERKESAKAASEAWKAKQVKHRRPEESDDYLERFPYDAYLATRELIMSINFHQ